MGSLKYPTLAATAFAALAATLAPSALGIAAGGQAAAPLRVELEPPRCQDASGQADPWLQNELADAPKVPIVRLNIRLIPPCRTRSASMTHKATAVRSRRAAR
jgi:hypothetical protein